METFHTTPSEAHIPTYDSIGDVDQARLYIDELLIGKVGAEHAQTWWNTPATEFDGLTPFAMWHHDPNTVIQWAHACVKDIK